MWSDSHGISMWVYWMSIWFFMGPECWNIPPSAEPCRLALTLDRIQNWAQGVHYDFLMRKRSISCFTKFPENPECHVIPEFAQVPRVPTISRISQKFSNFCKIIKNPDSQEMQWKRKFWISSRKQHMLDLPKTKYQLGLHLVFGPARPGATSQGSVQDLRTQDSGPGLYPCMPTHGFE